MSNNKIYRKTASDSLGIEESHVSEKIRIISSFSSDSWRTK